LTECVQSVLVSTMPVIVHVVDNASTDNSLPTLQQAFGNDKRVQIIKNQNNLGLLVLPILLSLILRAIFYFFSIRIV
jgi:glycosyltransferase involved in cell wall biosynthesis